MRQQGEVYDQANMGRRLGPAPRMLIATTPRPTPFIKKLVTQDRIVITTGSTLGQWGDEVVKACDEFSCDDCVVELNYGGAMASDVVRRAAERAFQLGKREQPYICVRGPAKATPPAANILREIRNHLLADITQIPPPKDP
jgi:phage terminase large subunit-like protein